MKLRGMEKIWKRPEQNRKNERDRKENSMIYLELGGENQEQPEARKDQTGTIHTTGIFERWLCPFSWSQFKETNTNTLTH